MPTPRQELERLRAEQGPLTAVAEPPRESPRAELGRLRSEQGPLRRELPRGELERLRSEQGPLPETAKPVAPAPTGPRPAQAFARELTRGSRKVVSEFLHPPPLKPRAKPEIATLKAEKLNERVRWVARTAERYDLDKYEASELLRQSWTPEKLEKVETGPVVYAMGGAPVSPMDVPTHKRIRERIRQRLRTGAGERAEERARAKRLGPADMPWGKMLGARYERGRAVVKTGRAGWAATLGTISPEKAVQRADAVEKQLEKLPADIPEWEWADLANIRGWRGVSRELVGATAELLPYVLESTERGAAYGAAGAVAAGTAALVGGQAGPQALAPEEIVTVPAATLLGFKVGFVTGVAENAAEIEGGNAFVEMVRAGIDPRIARPLALGVAFGNSALEVGQIGIALKSLPGVKQLFTQKLREQVARNPSVRRAFLNVGLNFAKRTGAEIGEEVAQEANNLVALALGEAIDALKEDRDYAGPDAQIALNRLKETIVQSAKGFPLLMLPGAIGETAQISAKAALAGLPNPSRALDRAAGVINTAKEAGKTSEQQIAAGAAILMREAKEAGETLEPETARAVAAQVVRGAQEGIAPETLTRAQAVVEQMAKLGRPVAQQRAAAAAVLQKAGAEPEAARTAAEKLVAPTAPIAAPAPAEAPGVAPTPPIAPEAAVVAPAAPEGAADVADKPEKQGFGLLSDEEGAFTPGKKRDVADAVRESVSKDPDAQAFQKAGEAAEEALRERNRGVLRRVYGAFKRKTIDVSANAKRALLKTKNETARRAARLHDLVYGATPAGAMRFQDAVRDIFSPLSWNEEFTLGLYLQAVRTIEVDEVARQRAAKRTFGKPTAQEAVERRTAEITAGPLLAGQVPVITPENVEENLAWIMQHPEGMDVEEARAFVRQAEAAPGFEKLRGAAEKYWAVHRDNLTRLHDEGIVGDAAFAYLTEKHRAYHPRLFLQWLDPVAYTTRVGGRTISVTESGIEALDEGSTNQLVNDLRFFLAQKTVRTETRIAMNRANRALLDFARDAPENELGIREARVVGERADGSLEFEKTPAGMRAVYVFENGIRRPILAPAEFAAEWVTQTPEMSAAWANAIRWLSGANVVKPFATGYNWAFAFTNVPRDVGLVWFASEWLTQETGVKLYSPFAPIAAVQMSRDFKAVLADTLARKGRFADYVEEGGGMEFLTHYGAIRRPGWKVGVLDDTQRRFQQESERVKNVLSYVGETSELLTRLMLRERALRNLAKQRGVGIGKLTKADRQTATWIARAYLDFSQGGSYTKALDTGLPYLNAAVQGLRSGIKSGVASPKAAARFTFRLAQVGAISAGLVSLALMKGKDFWDSVPDNMKDRYFIIPLPDDLGVYTDDQGNKRWYYLTISKPEIVRPFCAGAEVLAEAALTGEMPERSWYGAAGQVFEVVPLSKVPPTAGAYLAYRHNFDAWRGEAVWRGPEVEPQEEISPRVHPAFVRLAEQANKGGLKISPARLQRALGTIVPPYNPIVATASYAGQGLVGEASEKEKARIRDAAFRGITGIGRIVRSTPVRLPSEKMRRAKVSETTRRHKQNRELNKRFRAGEEPRAILREFIAKQEPLDKKRLADRLRRMIRVKGVKPWWLDLGDLQVPEVRARMFADRYNGVDDAEKREMAKMATRLGLRSKRFDYALGRFRALYEKEGE